MQSAISQYRKWLIYKEPEEILVCKLCITGGESIHNVWGDPQKGNSSFTTRSCDQHETSGAHQRAAKLIDSNTKLTDFISKLDKKSEDDNEQEDDDPEKEMIKSYHLVNYGRNFLL